MPFGTDHGFSGLNKHRTEFPESIVNNRSPSTVSPVYYVAGLYFQGADSERVADMLGLDVLNVLRKGQSLNTHGHGIPAFEDTPEHTGLLAVDCISS